MNTSFSSRMEAIFAPRSPAVNQTNPTNSPKEIGDFRTLPGPKVENSSRSVDKNCFAVVKESAGAPWAAKTHYISSLFISLFVLLISFLLFFINLIVVIVIILIIAGIIVLIPKH